MGNVAKFPVSDKQYLNKKQYLNTLKYEYVFNDLEKTRIYNFVTRVHHANTDQMQLIDGAVLQNILAATVLRGRYLSELQASDIIKGYKEDRKGGTIILPGVAGGKHSINRSLNRLARLGMIKGYTYTTHDSRRREKTVQVLGINLDHFVAENDIDANVHKNAQTYIQQCQETLMNFIPKWCTDAPVWQNTFQSGAPESHFGRLYNNKYSVGNKNPNCRPGKPSPTRLVSVGLEELSPPAAICHNEDTMKLSDIIAGRAQVPAKVKPDPVTSVSLEQHTYKADDRGIEQISQPKLTKRLKAIWEMHHPDVKFPHMSQADFYKFRSTFFQPKRFSTVQSFLDAYELAVVEWEMLRMNIMGWSAEKMAAVAIPDLPYPDARLMRIAGFVHTYANKTDAQKEIALIKSLASDHEGLVQTLRNKGMPEDVARNIAKRIERSKGIEDKEAQANDMIGKAQQAINLAKEAENRAKRNTHSGDDGSQGIFYDD